jgi:AcrR family transcriptional regulator
VVPAAPAAVVVTVSATAPLFWSQGFEATSFADLLAATGLSKSSL